MFVCVCVYLCMCACILELQRIHLTEDSSYVSISHSHGTHTHIYTKKTRHIQYMQYLSQAYTFECQMYGCLIHHSTHSESSNGRHKISKVHFIENKMPKTIRTANKSEIENLRFVWMTASDRTKNHNRQFGWNDKIFATCQKKIEMIEFFLSLHLVLLTVIVIANALLAMSWCRHFFRLFLSCEFTDLIKIYCNWLKFCTG